MNDVLDQITLDPWLRKVTNVSIEPKGLRFKCTRCVALFCEFGGPTLTKEDIERMKISAIIRGFFESTNGNGSSALLSGKIKVGKMDHVFF